MNDIQYIAFNQVDPDDFLTILNDEAVKRHLVPHAVFDKVTIRAWIRAKSQADAFPGCRVRAVFFDNVLAGWCGIQPDDNGVELALVLSPRYWGAGRLIFKTLLRWAGELGHQEIKFHLLASRPEYRFLKKMAREVRTTKLSGHNFTTYCFSVTQPTT